MGLTPKTRLGVHAVTPPRRLTSWKEIAAYLDRDPRTVQLWERLEGLPVHRLTHQARASVYAYTSEIDEWLRAHSEKRNIDPFQPPRAETAPSRTPRHFRVRDLYAVATVLTVVIAVGFLIEYRSAPASLPGTPTLAILPFQNQTSTDDFFVDGITQGLIADLDRVDKIRVIAGHSVMQFKGRPFSLPQIASELHASLILEGTVAQTGDQTQVTVELLDAVNNKHLWGAGYTRQSGDVLALQDEITSQIANDLTRRITGSLPQVVFPTRAIDPKAREDYLAGRYYWNQRDLPDMQKAIALFGQAISIDPQYVAAYSGLAESYDLMTDRGVLSDDEAFQRAKASARTALSLDPASAEAYTALAFATYRQDWDFARAEEYFRKAISLNPNYAVAHQWYGEFLGDMRRFDESIAELRKARDLDPLSPMISSDLADGYFHAGRLAESDAELSRVLELYPDFLYAHLYRISLYCTKSDFDSAEAEAQSFAQKTGDDTPLKTIAIRRLAAAGHMDQAREALEKFLSSPGGASFTAYSVAQLYFETQQDDAGYESLEKAYREHSWWLVTMLVDPGFGHVRNQPRFLDVARRVGLPYQSGGPNGTYRALALK